MKYDHTSVKIYRIKNIVLAKVLKHEIYASNILTKKNNNNLTTLLWHSRKIFKGFFE